MRHLRIAALLVISTLLCNPGFILADNSGALTSLSDVNVLALQWPSVEGGQTPVMSILKDTSHVFRFDREIKRVAVSNSEICDVTTVGERDVLVFAKKPGGVNLLVWDVEDRIATYSLQS